MVKILEGNVGGQYIGAIEFCTVRNAICTVWIHCDIMIPVVVVLHIHLRYYYSLHNA